MQGSRASPIGLNGTCAASAPKPYHDLVGEQNGLTGLPTNTGNSDVPALVSYAGTVISALGGVARNLLLLTTDQPSRGALGTIVDQSEPKGLPLILALIPPPQVVTLRAPPKPPSRASSRPDICFSARFRAR